MDGLLGLPHLVVLLFVCLILRKKLATYERKAIISAKIKRAAKIAQWKGAQPPRRKVVW